MTISQLVHMAERIHDAEHYNLGSSSSRDYRNAFFARVVGCAYHGHPVYNASPDRQWHIKKAGPSSPQSDDVCVSMPSREGWDCIPGSGADGYRFEADALGVLPAGQIVYPPPVPAGSGPPAPPVPPPHVCPVVPGYETLGGDSFFRQQIGVPLQADMALAGQSLNDGSSVWFSRTTYSLMAAFLSGGPVDAPAIVKRHRNEWRAALGLPPLP